MAFQDIKVRLLQVLRIAYPEPEPVSGEVIISVENKLNYNSLFPITEDGDIVYKAYIDSLGLATFFTDNSKTGIVVDKTAGTITLADIATDFPGISTNGIIRGSFDILIGGTWIANDVQPEMTKDVDGNLLTALFTLGNTGITTIRGRIF